MRNTIPTMRTMSPIAVTRRFQGPNTSKARNSPTPICNSSCNQDPSAIPGPPSRIRKIPVEEELLAEAGLALVGRTLVRGTTRFRAVDRDRGLPRPVIVEQLPALRALRRVERHDRLARRAFREDVLGLDHRGQPAPAVRRYR